MTVGERSANDGGDMAARQAVKPKQSKSRNGCITCKAKRLKCDETKPTCQQCRKRGVPCGGYHKDFKWRPFEESSVKKKPSKVPRKNNGITKPKKKSPSVTSSPAMSDRSLSASTDRTQMSPSLNSSLDASPQTLYPMQFATTVPQHSHMQTQQQQQQQQQHPIQLNNGNSILELEEPLYVMPHDSSMQIPSPPRTALFHEERPRPDVHFSRVLSPQASPLFMDDMTVIPTGSGYTGCASSKLKCGGSSQESDMASRHQNYMQSSLNYRLKMTGAAVFKDSPNPQNDIISAAIKHEIDEDEIEEIIRSDVQLTCHPQSQEDWLISFPSPAPSSASTSSSDSQSPQISIQDIFRRPSVTVDSQEMLLLHFDKHTCGIMSVKDGPSENPWRTLIWPLARESSALYHAIASMTAFHMSRDRPALRVQGMEHMSKAIHFLGQDVGDPSSRNDAALATTLVLAFSEAFDRHISTGRDHVRGAKLLLNQALATSRTSTLYGEGPRRLQFLYNVWLYLDVLARLTTDNDDQINGIDFPTSYGPLSPSSRNEIDPLLGCAGTLFPLIGQVADLVQKVRKCTKNSISIISQAVDLKDTLENWAPETCWETPEDLSADITHCLKTADAYRWATMLYLHQAVPELQSFSAHQLAERIMLLIASIPITSGSCIVHIYPLLIAGCEAASAEEREWVRTRWEAMAARMWIGNIDRAWEVIKEVWDRRDQFCTSRGLRNGYSPLSPQGSPAFEISIMHNREVLDAEANFENVFGSGVSSGRRRAMTDSTTGRPIFSDKFREGNIEYEISVRGELHWVRVMKDWGWEVLLG